MHWSKWEHQTDVVGAGARAWRDRIHDAAGLWYEDSVTGEPVSWARIATVQVLEAGYGMLTMGLGAVLSLAMRLGAVPGAAFGERICGIRLMQETSHSVE